jgi:magnesium transporter
VQPTLDRLGENALLWLALRDPTETEVSALQEALELCDEQARRLLEQPPRASLVDAGEHLHVTLYVAGGEGGEPVLRPVECVLGRNWVVTAHEAEIEVLEEFRERAEGGGQIGELDSPSFVAAVADWVVASYFRAFEEVENELEELDAKIMADIPKNVADELSRLVELRRSIGTLRRALAPHREVIAALAHPELDLLSTEISAQRFATLEGRVTQAVEAAREAKDSTRGSFDLLVARIGQRTNDIMKLFTLVTVILLPATVLAGVRDELPGRPLRPGLDVLGSDRRDARHRRARPLDRPQPRLDLAARRRARPAPQPARGVDERLVCPVRPRARRIVAWRARKSGTTRRSNDWRSFSSRCARTSRRHGRPRRFARSASR